MVLLGNYSAWNMFQSERYLPNRNRVYQATPLRKVQRWYQNSHVTRLQGWCYLHLNKNQSRTDVRACEGREHSELCRPEPGQLLCSSTLCCPHSVLHRAAVPICSPCCSQVGFCALRTQPTPRVSISGEVCDESPTTGSRRGCADH